VRHVLVTLCHFFSVLYNTRNLHLKSSHFNLDGWVIMCDELEGITDERVWPLLKYCSGIRPEWVGKTAQEPLSLSLPRFTICTFRIQIRRLNSVPTFSVQVPILPKSVYSLLTAIIFLTPYTIGYFSDTGAMRVVRTHLCRLTQIVYSSGYQTFSVCVAPGPLAPLYA
jgi:hypothetical protein